MPRCEQGLQPAFSATACFALVCSSSCKRYRKVKMRKPENRVLINEIRQSGRVAEWLKAPDSKSGVGVILSRVRISPLPPICPAGAGFTALCQMGLICLMRDQQV